MLSKEMQTLQSRMFARSSDIQKFADIFDVLGSECRLEIVVLLLNKKELSSGEIALATNCSPSSVSQSLAKMRATGMVDFQKHKNTVYYSLMEKHPYVRAVQNLLDNYFRL